MNLYFLYTIKRNRDSYTESRHLNCLCLPKMYGEFHRHLFYTLTLISLQFKGTNVVPGATPYNGLYGEAPPERDTSFRLEVHKSVGISRVEV